MSVTVSTDPVRDLVTELLHALAEGSTPDERAAAREKARAWLDATASTDGDVNEVTDDEIANRG